MKKSVSKEKLKELKLAAKAKDVKAIKELSDVYGGIMTRRGVKYLKKAAKLGDVDSQFNVGSLYEFEANFIINRGASAVREQRDSIVSKLEKAKFWYEKAADQKHEFAKERLEEVRDFLWNFK